MKVQELREKDDAALRKELSELHQEAFKLRMQRGTGQLGRPSEIKRVRRGIARVMTILGEREHAAGKQG
ncbi:MAG: 50S ribosomal protein L29 [Gammaproteobacteria bacterium]|nr:50S ribosomal protein L29 [Gammaproteobacteria bacterium]